jgi:thiol-disulfide isomerase/thioredoxin
MKIPVLLAAALSATVLLANACATTAPVSRAAPGPPEGADLVHVSERGEDVPELGPHAAPGKVTVFDFYADWCVPCRAVDSHVYDVLAKRSDIAYRKINIVSWETPVAKRYLTRVPTLPYVIVFGRDGKPVQEISGLDVDALDRAIEAAGRGPG